MTWQREGMVQLCLAYLVSRPAFTGEGVRKGVYALLTAIVGPLATASLTRYPGFPLMKLNDEVIRQGVRDLLIHVRQVETSAAL